MKKIYLRILYLMGFVSCNLFYGQVGMTNDKSIKVEPNTMLQVDSTTMGVLFPRLTTVQRDAITTIPTDVPNGLIIYNTDINCLQYWSSEIAGEQAQWKNNCSKNAASNTPVSNNPIRP